MGVLQKNRPFFIFLIKFGISYVVLSLVYWLYLSRFDATKFETDSMTYAVARQAEMLTDFTGNEAHIAPHESQACYRFSVNGRRVARIVEGCNAVSVMILFASFIIAFSSTFKKTALFIIAGIGIIHVLNVVRIALLCLSFYYYPEYKTIMHDIVFPLFIYGVVFALWIVWVQKFSIHAVK